MRIIVGVQDLRPGRASSSYTAGSYVRAVLKVRAVRRELAHTSLEVERCRKAFNSRRQPGVLLRQYHRTLPVIVITGDPGHERVQKTRTAGAFDVLAKPFGMTTLQNLVAQAMRVAPRP